MATIKVTQAHSLSQPAAIQAMRQFEEMLTKYKVKLDWKGNRAEIKGTGVGGDVQVGDREVTVRIELGMLARMAGIDAGRLEGSIRKRLESALGGQGAA